MREGEREKASTVRQRGRERSDAKEEDEEDEEEDEGGEEKREERRRRMKRKGRTESERGQRGGNDREIGVKVNLSKEKGLRCRTMGQGELKFHTPLRFLTFKKISSGFS